MATVEVRWTGEGLRFDGVTQDVTVPLASALDGPGAGARPMELLAVALGGCTGMDVVSILGKMRQPVEGFSIEVSGAQAEEHPRRFTSLEVTYRFRGDLDESKVRRAVELSESRYCAVMGTLRPAVPITTHVHIEH